MRNVALSVDHVVTIRLLVDDVASADQERPEDHVVVNENAADEQNEAEQLQRRVILPTDAQAEQPDDQRTHRV